jgi:holliday junction DNA helicase RuvA
MIGSLRGVVLERELEGVVLIEVGGVGYRVTVSHRALGELEPGTSAFLHVHHHIRDDAQQLFGFLARDERTTFQALLGTHGVGPALAMAIVATHPPTTLVDIVAEGDVAALTLVPGVGKKTAERLMVELRDRLSLPSLDPVATGGAGSSTVTDVREALSGLGYGPDEIREVLRQVPADTDAATMLRGALELLGARRA